MSLHIASCSCGQLTASVSGDPARVSVCHCRACQRRTGSAFGVQARFDREAVSIHGKGVDFVRTGDSGRRITFTFCPTCGATVYYALEGQEDYIGIPVGAFADASFPEPESAHYGECMYPWLDRLAALPRTDVPKNPPA